MRKIDETQIELGRRLQRLMTSEDFAPFLAHFEQELVELRDLLTDRDLSADALLRLNAKYRALKQLREWLDDEITAGGRELMRKQEVECAATTAEPAGTP